MKKKWVKFLDIYWELWGLDGFMQDQREGFCLRGRGRPRKSRLPEPFQRVVEAIKSEEPSSAIVAEFFKAIKIEELSSAFVFEFYLQCMDYHKGARAVLDWCNEHLKSKSLDERQLNLILQPNSLGDFHTALLKQGLLNDEFLGMWFNELNKEERLELESILDDPIFVRKDKANDQDLLWVWSGKLFEDPFDYIKKHVWMWNAAIEYCFNQLKYLGLTPTQEVMFRAMVDRLGRHKDLQSLIDYLKQERDGTKDQDSRETIIKIIKRAKQLMPIQHKKFRF